MLLYYSPPPYRTNLYHDTKMKWGHEMGSGLTPFHDPIPDIFCLYLQQENFSTKMIAYGYQYLSKVLRFFLELKIKNLINKIDENLKK